MKTISKFLLTVIMLPLICLRMSSVRIFKIIFYIESWIVYWHANRAICRLVYATGRQDRTPHIILSPEKHDSEALSFFQWADCTASTRTNKEAAAFILSNLSDFWREQSYKNKSQEEFRTFGLYSVFCAEASKALLPIIMETT